MQKYTIKAYGIEDAKQQAFDKYGAVVLYNITPTFRKRNDHLDVYAVNFMVQHEMFKVKNSAILYTVKSGKYVKHYYSTYFPKKRIGRCKTKRTIEVRSVKTDKVYGIAHTKMEAIKLAKKLMTTYREDLYGKTVYVATDIDFTLKFQPPKKSIMGEYIIFQVDDEDVRLYKRHERGYE